MPNEPEFDTTIGRCQETLNNRRQADPLHHGTNGLIHAIDDPLLMGRVQWNHFLKGQASHP